MMINHLHVAFSSIVSWTVAKSMGHCTLAPPLLACSGPDGAHRCMEPIALMDRLGNGVDGLVVDLEVLLGTRGKFIHHC